MTIKKYHIILGLIMTLFGLACTGFSIMNYLKPEMTVNINTVKSKAMAECQQYAMVTGFNISKTPDELVLTPREASLENPVPYIYKSSLMIEKCKNLNVKYFCMGEECEKTIVLKFEFPKI